MDVNLDIGKADVFVTQTSVHTLSLTSKAWSDMFAVDDSEVLIFNHYVICNQTQDILHLQQVIKMDYDFSCFNKSAMTSLKNNSF